MKLQPVTDLYKLSPDTDWAIGHFNTHNLVMIKGVIAAAQKENAPVVLAIGYQSIHHMGLSPLAAAVRAFAAESDLPMALHLDHGRELELVRKSLDLGFSSIMFDGSSLPFADNIRVTAEVARMAHDAGASVEGEVGIVPQPGATSADVNLTDVAQAAEFAEQTGVDLLAVSLGSIHGIAEAWTTLDQELLARLRAAVPVPLVLHGASGVTDDSVSKAIHNGIRKVNVNTGLKHVAVQRMSSVLANSHDPDFLTVLDNAVAAIAETTAAKMRLFGASGRAARSTHPH